MTDSWCIAPGAEPPIYADRYSLAQLLRTHERQAHGEELEEWEQVVLDQLYEHGPWIQTWTGRVWPLLAPRPEDVVIGEIAYALAGLPRYTGHARRTERHGHPYSVAQHSVLASYLVPPAHALVALLHDAAEAYVGDDSSPKKHCIPDLARLERISFLAIARRFGLPIEPQLSPDVKHADLVLLATEKRDLMAPEPKSWLPLPEPSGDGISIWPPKQAERAFLRRFHELFDHVPNVGTGNPGVKS